MAFVYWIRHKDTAKHNDITQHGYIGITSRTVEARFKQHQGSVRKGSEYPVHAAMRKYVDDIVVQTLLEGSIEYCQEIEKKLRPRAGIGYNCAIGGAATTLGAVYSAEVRAKIADSARGRKHSAEAKRKMSEAQKARPPASDETRRKLSEALKGNTLSEETKQKISAAHIGRVHTFSDEHCARLSEAGKGRVQSEETKQKIREKATGRVKSQEAKDKQSLAMSGRVLWRNCSARLDVWALAIEFYQKVKDFPNKSAKLMSRELGIEKCNPWSLVAKLREGWVPAEDEDYISWLTEYKLKESNEIPCTT